MGVEVAVKNIVLPTSGPTFDVTVDGFGTPLWYTVEASYATALDTSTNHLVQSRGAGDGTREWAVGVQSEHGSGTNDTDRISSATASLILLNAGLATANGQLGFNSFITNGIRFDVDNDFGAGYLATVTLFKGTDVSVRVDNFAIQNAQDDTIDVTAPAFQPTWAEFASISNASHGTDTTAILSQGIAVDNGGISQRNVMWGQKEAGTSAVVVSEINNNRIASAPTVATTAIDWRAELTAWLATGFRVATRDSGAASQIIYYIAVRDPDNAASCFTVTQPTSTGDNTQTVAGHKPQYLRLLHSRLTAVNTFTENNDAAVCGSSSIDATTQGSVSGSSEDAVGTTVTKSRKDNIALNISNHQGSDETKATFVSFEATGWKFNYSAVRTGAATLLAGLSLEETAGADTINPTPVTIPVSVPIVQLDTILNPAPVTIPVSTPIVQLDTLINPAPVAIPLVAPSVTLEQADIVNPTPVLIALAMPSVQLDTVLYPTPVITSVSSPSVQLDTVLHPDPIIIPVATPSVQLDTILHPTPIGIPVSVPTVFLGQVDLINPTPVVMAILAPSVQLDTVLHPAPIAIPVSLPTVTLASSLTLSPSSVLIPNGVPIVQLDTVLHPAPVTLPILVPSVQVNTAINPSSVGIPLAMPSVQLDTILYPTPVGVIIVAPTVVLLTGVLPTGGLIYDKIELMGTVLFDNIDIVQEF